VPALISGIAAVLLGLCLMFFPVAGSSRGRRAVALGHLLVGVGTVPMGVGGSPVRGLGEFPAPIRRLLCLLCGLRRRRRAVPGTFSALMQFTYALGDLPVALGQLLDTTPGRLAALLVGHE
jgi:hypothetical protein